MAGIGRPPRGGRVAAALALAALLLAACGSEPDPGIPEPGGDGPVLGYNDTLIPNGEDGLLAASGAQVVRRPLNWTAIERAPGKLDWGATDIVAEQLSEAGLQPLWTINSAPCWAAADASCESSLPSYAPARAHYADYADFSAAVAERYPDSAGIEVWNEPNLERFFIGGGDADDYSELFKRTADAIHLGGTGVPVIAAGLSPVIAEQADEDHYAWEPYLQAMIDVGVAEAAAGIGLHPYSALAPGTEFVANAAGQLAAAERIVGDEPIYVTEVGLTTAGPNAVTPAQQAEGLRQAYETFAAEDVPLIVIHRFFDERAPEFPAEAGYGVVAADQRTLKPAYCAIAELGGEPCPGS